MSNLQRTLLFMVPRKLNQLNLIESNRIEEHFGIVDTRKIAGTIPRVGCLLGIFLT